MKPYMEEEIKVGTVLVYRNETQSYKYFRILNIFEKETEWNVDTKQRFFPDKSPDYIPWRPRKNGEFNDYHFVYIKHTEFEMARNLEGEWIKANHTCPVLCWHENCDILFQAIESKRSRLMSIE